MLQINEKVCLIAILDLPDFCISVMKYLSFFSIFALALHELTLPFYL